jgi:hypothetical protein
MGDGDFKHAIGGVGLSTGTHRQKSFQDKSATKSTEFMMRSGRAAAQTVSARYCGRGGGKRAPGKHDP